MNRNDDGQRHGFDGDIQWRAWFGNDGRGLSRDKRVSRRQPMAMWHKMALGTLGE